MIIKNKILNRIGNVFKTFFSVPPIPFAFSGFTTHGTLRAKSVEADPVGGYAGWVYAALSKRAKRVGAIELRLYELNNKEEINEIHDHDVLSLLDKANPIQSRYQFFYTIEMMLGIWGSAPILKDRMGGKRIQYLWILRPDLLKAKSKDGRIVSYEYRAGTKIDIYPAEDVILINEPSPKSILAGFSPVQAAALEIDVDIQAALWNKYLLDNFSEPGGVLTTDQSIDDKSFERIKKQWEQRHAGVSNAGRWALLEKGLKAEAIGRSPRDMDLNESRKANRNSIVAILGVPMGLMTSEDVNLANAQVAEKIFQKDTIEPQMKLIVGMLNEFLVSEYSDKLELDFNSPVPEDVQQNINLAVAGEGRYLTVNECRDIFNLEPIEGGDAIYKPLGVYPQVGNPTGMNDPADSIPKGFKKIIAKSTYKEDKRKARIKASILARTYTKRAFISGLTKKIGKKIESLNSNKEVKVKGIRMSGKSEETEIDPRLKAERIEYVKRLPRQQRKYTSRFQGYFRNQEEEVLKNLEEEGLPKGKSQKGTNNWINKITFNQPNANKLIIGIAGEMYRDNITIGAFAVARILGLEPTNVLATPFVINYIQDRSFKMLSVNKTTTDALRDTLAEGLAQGESLGQIRDRITDVYDKAQDFRAEMIARTEVGSAQNYGRTAEMKEQGVKNKIWIAIFSNTRDTHAEANGQVVHTDESFDVGGERLSYPGDPAGSPENTINCQCSVSPTLKDIT